MYDCADGLCYDSPVPAASSIDVSVIIPVGPGRSQLDLCLEPLSRCRPRPAEITVAVDGAGEATSEQALRLGADVVIQPTVLGPAAARIRGAEQARSEILLFIDSDIVVKPDIIGRKAA